MEVQPIRLPEVLERQPITFFSKEVDSGKSGHHFTIKAIEIGPTEGSLRSDPTKVISLEGISKDGQLEPFGVEIADCSRAMAEDIADVTATILERVPVNFFDITQSLVTTLSTPPTPEDHRPLSQRIYEEIKLQSNPIVWTHYGGDELQVVMSNWELFKKTGRKIKRLQDIISGALSTSTFDAFKKGNFETGLAGLVILKDCPNVHRLALNLYDLEQTKAFESLSSAKVAELRIIRQLIYEKIESDLKLRGVVIDYPDRPEKKADSDEAVEQKKQWEMVLDKTPKAVIVAALKESVIVIPSGEQRHPHTRRVLDHYEGAGVSIGGVEVNGKEITNDGKFLLTAIPVDLTQNAEIIFHPGINYQTDEEHSYQSTVTEDEPDLLVTKKADGLYHVDLSRILPKASYMDYGIVPKPFILDTHGGFLPQPNWGSNPGEGFWDYVRKIRRDIRP